jgi:acid phosphatase (class A)
MSRLPRLFIPVLAIALFAAAARAAFIAPDALDPLQVVPPPPAEDSIAEAADRLSVAALTSQRTDAQVALARQWAKYEVFKLVQPVLGDWATPQTLPKLAKFIADSAVETQPFTDKLKKAYSRPRPFVTNPAIAIVVDRPESTSYPSGHATGSALHAALLAAIWPERAADFLHQAELVRLARLYAGVHYPSDVVAGRRLGEAIAREMLKSPQTQRAIEEARAEIAAAIAAHRKAA